VTDKDTDHIAETVFQKLRLDERTVKAWSPLLATSSSSSSERRPNRVALASPRKRPLGLAAFNKDDRDASETQTPVGRLIRGNSNSEEDKTANVISIVSALASSRDVCKLPYLNGAALVVYGIPFYLWCSSSIGFKSIIVIILHLPMSCAITIYIPTYSMNLASLHAFVFYLPYEIPRIYHPLKKPPI